MIFLFAHQTFIDRPNYRARITKHVKLLSAKIYTGVEAYS